MQLELLQRSCVPLYLSKKAERDQYPDHLSADFLIMLGLCYFIQNPTICLIGGFVIGFAGAGGVLQLAVSTTAEFFPENKGTATSMVMIASSVANYTILTLAGYITKTAGTSAPRMILLLNMAVTFIGILLALFVKMNRGKEA